MIGHKHTQQESSRLTRTGTEIAQALRKDLTSLVGIDTKPRRFMEELCTALAANNGTLMTPAQYLHVVETVASGDVLSGAESHLRGVYIDKFGHWAMGYLTDLGDFAEAVRESYSQSPHH